MKVLKRALKKKPVAKGTARINKDGTKQISVQSAKSKGRNLQKFVGKKVAELLNEPFGPDEDIASRPMGQSGCDIRLSPRILKKFPYSIECKCQERFNVVTALKQAVNNQQEGTEWLLFYTKNRFPTVVSMDADHFFELMQRIYDAKKPVTKKLQKP